MRGKPLLEETDAQFFVIGCRVVARIRPLSEVEVKVMARRHHGASTHHRLVPVADPRVF